MKFFNLTEGRVKYILKTSNSNFKSLATRNNLQYLNDQTIFFVKKKIQSKSFDTRVLFCRRHLAMQCVKQTAT